MGSPFSPERQDSRPGALRNRFHRSTDTESEQATVRAIAATAGLLYFLLAWKLFPDGLSGALSGTTRLFGGYLLFSLMLLGSVLTSPGRSVPRRAAGILADVGVISCGMYLSAVFGALLYPAYFLVIFGNGFRYGIRYLYATTALCSGAFALMIASSGYWASHAELAVALLIGLFAIPLYVSVLMQRTNAALNRAEEAQRASKRLRNTFQEELAEGSDREPHADRSSVQKVLVLTRDTSDQHNLIQYLNGWNTQIITARSIAMGLFELVSAVREKKPFQSVLVDSRHVEFQPVDLATAVRDEPALDGLSLIQVATIRKQDEETRLLAAGYSDCLHVPIDKTLLFNALHSKPSPNSFGDQHPSVSRIIDRRSSRQRAMPALDILLAGHHHQTHQAIRRVLERAGHTVHAVRDGEQALEALGNHQFDLAIVDQKMPLMSGLQVAKLYRFTHLEQSDMPFIVIGENPIGQAGRFPDESGVDVWITTPIRGEELLATVTALIATGEESIAPQAPDGNSSCNRKAAVELKRANLPTLDSRRLRELEELSVDPAFVEALIGGFLSESREALQGMARALAAERRIRFIDLAQAIKGSAANIGTVVLYELSACACRLTAAQFPKEAGRLLGEMEDAFGSVELSLQEYLRQRHSGVSEV